MVWFRPEIWLYTVERKELVINIQELSEKLLSLNITGVNHTEDRFNVERVILDYVSNHPNVSAKDVVVKLGDWVELSLLDPCLVDHKPNLQRLKAVVCSSVLVSNILIW